MFHTDRMSLSLTKYPSERNISWRLKKVNKRHLVAALEEALREIVDVALDPAKIGVEEIGDH